MYHYTESGLNNIWLVNGVHKERTPYGIGVRIDDQDGLNHCIAFRIVNDRPYMTGAEFRFVRKVLDMSQPNLAAIMGKDAQSVARWEKKGRVPKMPDRMLRFIFQGYTSGHAEIKALVERLNELDQQVHAKMQFEKAGRTWKAKAA